MSDEKDESRDEAVASEKAVATSKVATNGGGAEPNVSAAGHGAHPVTAHAATAGAHGAHGDHGLAHTTPVPLLLGVLGALMLLTVITVAVTAVDLGAQGNLVVAMVIATIKAALVVAFFMHIVWDKKLHLILFLTSVLFLILFLSLSVNDRGEYQKDIDYFQQVSGGK